ncbi:putative Protein phosphatase 2C [Fusarium oxysporum f. sp. albedinis]|nr:putative Protein phosphatase 2C [Fusarium oxysporum f. sp. albedinis]
MNVGKTRLKVAVMTSSYLIEIDRASHVEDDSMLLLTNLEGSCSWAKGFCQWQAGVSELQLSPSSQGYLTYRPQWGTR